MKIIKQSHKGQITVEDLEKVIKALKNTYGEEAKNIPVYIGDDDELNGIHCAWCTDAVPQKTKCNPDQEYCREMINERTGNHTLGDNEVALLIS